MAADAEKRASAEAAKAEVAAAKKAAAAVAKQPERVASSAPTIKPVGQSKVSVQEDLKRLGLKTYKWRQGPDALGRRRGPGEDVGRGWSPQMSLTLIRHVRIRFAKSSAQNDLLG